MYGKDGDILQVFLRAYAVKNDTGNITNLVGIHTDITDRKRMEDALQKQRDRAQKYLDIAAVVFVALDSLGNVTLINKKGCGLLGWDEPDILGKNWFDSFLTEGIREQVKTVYQELMAGNVKAVEYYEDGEYVKAGTLFQELVNIYRGTSRADKIYYFYAKSMIGQKDYLMAGHYFNTLIKEFPTSEYVEEAQYMVGYCSYLISPKARLDQQVTQEAIDALQLYINLYPFNERVDEANRLIDELRDKLVFKSYLSAKLYFDFDNYFAEHQQTITLLISNIRV